MPPVANLFDLSRIQSAHSRPALARPVAPGAAMDRCRKLGEQQSARVSVAFTHQPFCLHLISCEQFGNHSMDYVPIETFDEQIGRQNVFGRLRIVIGFVRPRKPGKRQEIERPDVECVSTSVLQRDGNVAEVLMRAVCRLIFRLTDFCFEPEFKWDGIGWHFYEQRTTKVTGLCPTASICKLRGCTIPVHRLVICLVLVGIQ